MKKSTPQFNCCLGCIDGMLVWTEKPTEHNCAVMNCGPMRFMCGWKGKYGLNQQGVCDHIQRFTSIWILHPGLSSDFLSFIRSSLYRSLPIPRIGNFWRSRLHQQFLYGNSIQECKRRRERQLQFLPFTTLNQY